MAKLKETQTNDTLADKGTPFNLAAIKFPEPVISYAIEPKSRGDEEKISTSLHRLQDLLDVAGQAESSSPAGTSLGSATGAARSLLAAS